MEMEALMQQDISELDMTEVQFSFPRRDLSSKI